MNGEGPLRGVRVIDVSTSYAGPVASMYLADLGADVIKVERPGRGDDARHWGPPFVNGESAWFLAANRNKQSIALDFRRPEGHRVLMRMLEHADVFVESFNPSKLAQLGIEPSQILKTFPRIVYCAISAFGLDGPEADQPGYDLIAQARSGLMSLTGPQGGHPERVSTALSDIVTGIIGALAITAALRRQERDGVGDLIDISLLDAALALVSPRLSSFLAGEEEPQPSGATDSVIAIYQRFETGDDPIVVAVGNDSTWKRFCSAIDRPDLAERADLSTNAGRRENRPVLIQELQSRLSERTAAEWIERLRSARVPCSRVQFLASVVSDPQIAARRSLWELHHPTAGIHTVVAPPWRLSSAKPDSVARAAPSLGDSTREILASLGFGCHDVQELRRLGILGDE